MVVSFVHRGERAGIDPKYRIRLRIDVRGNNSAGYTQGDSLHRSGMMSHEL
jgi:hypothetical protein